MQRRNLGNTGIEVGVIGLGTVKLGRNTDVKYPAGYALPDDAQVAALLERALALGVTLIDTAPAYGTSEDRLRPFLAQHRDQIVLCSKAGEHYQGGVSTYDFSPAALTASVEASLRRLGTDHLDLLLLHADAEDAALLRREDTLAALQQLRVAGKARAVGASVRTAEAVALAAERLDVVMAPFSLAAPELGEALTAAHRAGAGVLVIKALDSGRLAWPAGAVAADLVGEAVRYVLAQPFAGCLVAGTIDPTHLARLADEAEEREP